MTIEEIVIFMIITVIGFCNNTSIQAVVLTAGRLSCFKCFSEKLENQQLAGNFLFVLYSDNRSKSLVM